MLRRAFCITSNFSKRITSPNRPQRAINQIRLFSYTGSLRQEKKTVTVTYVDQEGKEHVVQGEIGDNIMSLAHKNDIDLEGACEGSLACSTCHVIVDPEYYDKIPEPVDEENDMLDLAFGLTETSRLGCQVKLTPELDGIRVTLPSATRNLAVDGYKPKHH